MLKTTQTVNPNTPGQPMPMPVLSPRGLAEALGRELHHKSGGVQPQPPPKPKQPSSGTGASPRGFHGLPGASMGLPEASMGASPRGFHGPPVPRAARVDAAEAGVRAARAAADAVGGNPFRAFAKGAADRGR